MSRQKDIKSGDSKKNVAVSNRSKLSTVQPIPFERGQAFSYINKFKYLPFLGADNDFGKLLLESRLLSTTNNSCIVTKKEYCAGSGFQYSEGEPFSTQITDWLEIINRHGQKAVDISSDVFESHFTYGNTPIELVRYSVGSKKYFHIYVHDLLEWRLGVPDSDGVINEVIHSRLFLNDKYALTEDDYKNAKVLPLYNPFKKDSENWRTIDGAERTMIWYKNRVTGFKHYGLPSNVASLIYQLLEYKGARFNLDNIDNGMVVSAILALRGSYDETEINRIAKKAVDVHVGDGKRGRIMVVGSEDGIEGSDLHSLNTYKEGSFSESDNLWSQKIIVANQWDAVLMGLLSSNTLGKGTGFLTKILEIKQKTVINPAQQDLLENVWKPIFNLANKWLGLKIDVSKIEIRNSIDISGLTDVDITPAVKVNEVRESKNLPKLDDKEKGEMLLGELKGSQMKGVYVKDSGNNPDPNNQK